MSMRQMGQAFALVVSLSSLLVGCGKSKEDKYLECSLKCGEIQANGEKTCGQDDAECWKPVHEAYNACDKACAEAAGMQPTPTKK